MTEKGKQLWIGINDEHTQVVWEEETLKQIEKLMEHELDLIYPDGQKVQWTQINDPAEDQSLLRYIVVDRRIREKNLMADRPPFAIATIKNGKVVRLEVYTGHDELALERDLRSRELQGKNLRNGYSEQQM